MKGWNLSDEFRYVVSRSYTQCSVDNDFTDLIKVASVPSKVQEGYTYSGGSTEDESAEV